MQTYYNGFPAQYLATLCAISQLINMVIVKVSNLTTTTREYSLCLTKLEEAEMWFDKRLTEYPTLRQALDEYHDDLRKEKSSGSE